MANKKYPQTAKKHKASGRGSGYTLDPGQRAWGTFREETLRFWQKELKKLDSLKHKPNPLRKKK
jgi:uncharacterized protein YecT (DUF1311 family)